MHVECLPKEGYPSLYTLYIEGKAWRDIHTAIFGKNPQIALHGGSFDCLKQDFQQQEYAGAEKYVLKRLAIKSYHSQELYALLERYLVSESVICALLTVFRTRGYLDDQDWIKCFIFRHLRRNLGPLEIARKLKKKGISEQIISQSLEKWDTSQFQQQRIIALLKTRYKTRNLDDFREKQKIIGALWRKGFDLEQIHEVIERRESLK